MIDELRIGCFGHLAFGIVLQNTDSLVLLPFLLKIPSKIEILSSSVNKLVCFCVKWRSGLRACVCMTNISKSVRQAWRSAVRTRGDNTWTSGSRHGDGLPFRRVSNAAFRQRQSPHRDATAPTDYRRSHGTNLNNLRPTPTAVGVILPFVPLAHFALTVWLLKRPLSDFDGNEVREKCFSPPC